MDRHPKKTMANYGFVRPQWVDYSEKPLLPKRLLFIYVFEGWGGRQHFFPDKLPFFNTSWT